MITEDALGKLPRFLRGAEGVLYSSWRCQKSVPQPAVDSKLEEVPRKVYPFRTGHQTDLLSVMLRKLRPW